MGFLQNSSLTLFLTLLLLLAPMIPADAYIGPGLGVALVWTLIGPIAAVVTLILIIAYFPLRYLYKKRKYKKEQAKKKEWTDDGDSLKG